MISIQSVTKMYNAETVLDVPELSIPADLCFGLVGNNGAGKTTLFRILLDLIKPTTGHVRINGEIVSEHESWKQTTGAYLDEHMLLPFLTPEEYFETLQKIHHLTEAEVALRLEQFAPLFNGEIMGGNKKIRELSKGNIKKTGIAAAMLHQPDVVVLDEPFESLDPTSQTRLKRIIQQEREQRGTLFLISSHDLIHVIDICDRILLLEKGTIQKDLQASREEMDAELRSYFDR